MAKVKFKKNDPAYKSSKDLRSGTLCEIMSNEHVPETYIGTVVTINYEKEVVCLSTGDTWDSDNKLDLRVLEPHEIVELSNV